MMFAAVAGSVRAVPRATILLLLSQFFGSLPIGVLLVFFPLYLHDLGMKSLIIGGIFTAAGIGSSFLLIGIGPLADRWGRRPFLLAGSALPALGFLIFMRSTATGWLVVASLLGGVGFSGGLGGGLVTATFNPMLAGTVPARLRTTVMTLAEGAWATAIGIGALLAGVPALLARAKLVPQLTAGHALFAGCLCSAVLATALIVPVHDRHAVTHDALAGSQADPAPSLRSALPLILRIAVFFTLQGAGLGLVVQLLPLWFSLRFHTTAASIAPWFAVAQVAGLPILLVVPALARRLGIANVIALVSTSSTAFLAGMAAMPLLAPAGLLFVARSALVSVQWPAQQSFLQGAVHPRVRGTATSIALGCWSVANAACPSLAGYLLDRHLLLWPPLLGVACYGAAACWFWCMLRHTPLPEEAPAPAGDLDVLAEATAR